jgi:FkbM family methyltransferase
MLIFDIGANIGTYSLKKLCLNPNIKIIAVEPHINAFNKLKTNLNIYNDRVILYNFAVSNEINDIDFYECLNGDGSHGPDSCSTCSINHIKNSCFGDGEQGKFKMKNGKTFSEHYMFDKPVKIKTISLDKLINLHGVPNLIKLDVEGYENNVLKSLTNNNVKQITFEWHEYNIEQIIDSIKYLSKLGYKYFSTEIWYEGKFEHDNEILNYKSCDDFINWLEPIIRKSISLTGNLNEKVYIENNIKIPYINIWGMIWVK